MTLDLDAIAIKVPRRDPLVSLPAASRPPIERPSEPPLDPLEAERRRSEALNALLGLKSGTVPTARDQPETESPAPPWPPASDNPIDLEALIIRAPSSGEARKRKPTHAELYVIPEEELKARLAARRRARRVPRRNLGEITNHHRIVGVMEPGRWYITRYLSDATGLPLSRVTRLMCRMHRWPFELIERVPIKERFPDMAAEPYLVPSPLTAGGRTLRTPAQWAYRLTDKGIELKREAEAFIRRDMLS